MRERTFQSNNRRAYMSTDKRPQQLEALFQQEQASGWPASLASTSALGWRRCSTDGRKTLQ